MIHAINEAVRSGADSSPKCKDQFMLPTSVLSTYLLKMRTLARNTIRQSITGAVINEEEKT